MNSSITAKTVKSEADIKSAAIARERGKELERLKQEKAALKDIKDFSIEHYPENPQFHFAKLTAILDSYSFSPVSKIYLVLGDTGANKLVERYEEALARAANQEPGSEDKLKIISQEVQQTLPRLKILLPQKLPEEVAKKLGKEIKPLLSPETAETYAGQKVSLKYLRSEHKKLRAGQEAQPVAKQEGLISLKQKFQADCKTITGLIAWWKMKLEGVRPGDPKYVPYYEDAISYLMNQNIDPAARLLLVRSSPQKTKLYQEYASKIKGMTDPAQISELKTLEEDINLLIQTEITALQNAVRILKTSKTSESWSIIYKKIQSDRRFIKNWMDTWREHLESLKSNVRISAAAVKREEDKYYRNKVDVQSDQKYDASARFMIIRPEYSKGIDDRVYLNFLDAAIKGYDVKRQIDNLKERMEERISLDIQQTKRERPDLFQSK